MKAIQLFFHALCFVVRLNVIAGINDENENLHQYNQQLNALVRVLNNNQDPVCKKCGKEFGPISAESVPRNYKNKNKNSHQLDTIECWFCYENNDNTPIKGNGFFIHHQCAQYLKNLICNQCKTSPNIDGQNTPLLSSNSPDSDDYDYCQALFCIACCPCICWLTMDNSD